MGRLGRGMRGITGALSSEAWHMAVCSLFEAYMGRAISGGNQAHRNCLWPHFTRARIPSAKELAAFSVPIPWEQFKYSSTCIPAETRLGLIMLDFSRIRDGNSGEF